EYRGAVRRRTHCGSAGDRQHCVSPLRAGDAALAPGAEDRDRSRGDRRNFLFLRPDRCSRRSVDRSGAPHLRPRDLAAAPRCEWLDGGAEREILRTPGLAAAGSVIHCSERSILMFASTFARSTIPTYVAAIRPCLSMR